MLAVHEMQIFFAQALCSSHGPMKNGVKKPIIHRNDHSLPNCITSGVQLRFRHVNVLLIRLDRGLLSSSFFASVFGTGDDRRG